MRTLTTSIILSLMFLSAGAFAGASRGMHAIATSGANPANVTTVAKNAAWPPAGQITVEPCSHHRCFDI